MTTETTTAHRAARILPQLIKFGAVGAVGFGVNLVVFNVMLLIVLRNVQHATIYSTIIATVIAILTNWIGNRYWAFSGQRQDNAAREGVEFFAVSLATGTGIPLVCVWISHYLLGMVGPVADNISANVVGLAVGMLFRFALYRWWVFSPARAARSKAKAETAATVGATTTTTAEPAATTGSTLARTPDGGLVGD
ncbi:GtrA family protein [Leifsonia shinshuensis]|uniref:GtrA family protein n=1 Tax=Leifsonia shinshuensis TaxID=150026 RepID=A0A7G6Y9D9_9MICO|nr:GtrA family protein [Leifsonia shinshuensis]QNE35104.1 GtrA family protein [Leifsonia shinshuensis]